MRVIHALAWVLTIGGFLAFHAAVSVNDRVAGEWSFAVMLVAGSVAAAIDLWGGARK